MFKILNVFLNQFLFISDKRIYNKCYILYLMNPLSHFSSHIQLFKKRCGTISRTYHLHHPFLRRPQLSKPQLFILTLHWATYVCIARQPSIKFPVSQNHSHKTRASVYVMNKKWQQNICGAYRYEHSISVRFSPQLWFILRVDYSVLGPWREKRFGPFSSIRI